MEDRNQEEALYQEISRAVLSSVETVPGMALVPPDGFQSFLSGLAQVWKKSTTGVLVHHGKDGLIVDVSVSVRDGTHLSEDGRKLQEEIVRRLSACLPEPAEAVNIDILKIVK